MMTSCYKNTQANIISMVSLPSLPRVLKQGLAHKLFVQIKLLMPARIIKGSAELTKQ